MATSEKEDKDKNKKTRLAIVITEELSERIIKASDYFSIPRTSFIIQATVEKLEKFESRYDNDTSK